MSKQRAVDGQTARLFEEQYVSKTFNLEPKLKTGHNSVRILDRVTCCCLQIGGMIVIKYFKFQSNISNSL